MANSNARSAGDEQVRRDGLALPAVVREPQQAAKSTKPLEEQALPQLIRPRMPRAQRAKIFIPFDPLKGYQEALRQKEREAEAAHNERGGLEEGA